MKAPNIFELVNAYGILRTALHGYEHLAKHTGNKALEHAVTYLQGVIDDEIKALQKEEK